MQAQEPIQSVVNSPTHPAEDKKIESAFVHLEMFISSHTDQFYDLHTLLSGVNIFDFQPDGVAGTKAALRRYIAHNVLQLVEEDPPCKSEDECRTKLLRDLEPYTLRDSEQKDKWKKHLDDILKQVTTLAQMVSSQRGSRWSIGSFYPATTKHQNAINVLVFPSLLKDGKEIRAEKKLRGSKKERYIATRPSQTSANRKPVFGQDIMDNRAQVAGRSHAIVLQSASQSKNTTYTPADTQLDNQTITENSLEIPQEPSHPDTLVDVQHPGPAAPKKGDAAEHIGKRPPIQEEKITNLRIGSYTSREDWEHMGVYDTVSNKHIGSPQTTTHQNQDNKQMQNDSRAAVMSIPVQSNDDAMIRRPRNHVAHIPDLIVGVDLGTTYTGVSYLIPKLGELPEPPVIQRWSDKVDKVFNKVPTVIAKTETGVTWGIEAQSERDSKQALIFEHFKLLLEQKMLDYVNKDETVQITMARIQGWFRIFLGNLYDWISQQLEAVIESSLRDAVVEFIFSVPTMWEEETVDNYLTIIKEAGFGKVGGHKVSIGLNEAEAAAVHTAMYNLNHETDGFKQDDIVLVCDAGGGTTDVSLLQVTGFFDTIPKFHQMCRIDGVAVGSVLIDEAFRDLVKSRLSHLSQKCNVEHAASGEFQDIKSHLGTNRVDRLKEVTIKIPGLRENIEDPKARISGGSMKFSRDEIKKLFDDLLPGIYQVIDNLLRLVSDKYPSAQVNYFVLSGGLGSSKYVQQKLNELYFNNPRFPIAKEIKVIIAKDPQLVVCRGLVLDRVHRIFNVNSVISQRCCPASYGFVLDELYNKATHKHLKRERIKSKVDGRYYLPERIRWFIDRDEPVDYKGSLIVPFSRNVDLKQTERLHLDIVRFDGELPNRPDKFILNMCSIVSRLQYSLESILREGDTQIVQKEFKHKLLFPGIRWGKYSRVTYDISVHLDSASAGLRLELCVGGEKQGEVEDLDVKWTKEMNKLEAVEYVLDRTGDSQSESDGTHDGVREIIA